MTCFEISVNGKKVCTAGVPDGVLSFHADWVGPYKGRPKDPPEGWAHWSVGGFTEQRGHEEYVRWGSLRKLKAGDVLTVRVISSDTADKPTERERKKKK